MWVPRNEAERKAADDAVRFISSLIHTKDKWAGTPFCLMPWQEHDIVRPLFGTLQADGRRQYRTAYVEIPRKNGKSELSAAILLKLLFADQVQQGEVYGAATTRDQATCVFNMAAFMVQRHPILRNRAKILPSTKRIVVTHGRSAGSFYRAIPAEAGPAHGFNASAIIYDELHAAPSRDLWDALATSTVVREQPLTLATTTAGFDRTSLCWEMHARVGGILKLRDPDRYGWLDLPAAAQDDPTVFGVIYGTPETADWTSLETARRANPSFGITVPAEYFQANIQQAKENPSYQNTFRRLHLNQWTGQSSRWLDMARWDSSAGNVDERKLRGRIAYSGLDLSSTTDLTAFALIFPPADIDRGDFKLITRFWLPEEGLQARIRRDQAPYDLWAAAGYITLTDGPVVDHQSILRQIQGDRLRYDLRECAFDRWNAGNTPNEIEAFGVEALPFGQGFRDMSWPTKEFDRLIRERRLHHGGNPVLRWMADAVAVRSDAAGNLKPDKEKSTRRIDGIVAAIMALSRALTMGAAKSPYEARGVEWI